MKDTDTTGTADDSKATNNKKKTNEQEAMDVTAVDFEEEYEIGDLIDSATIVQVNEESEYFRVKLPKGLKNGKSI